MTKKQSILIVMAGAALAAASQAQAQVTPYADGDLLLNFRDTSSATPPNVTADLGNINTFLSSVAPGATVEEFSGATLGSALGVPPSASDVIGFSAAADNSGSDTLWLTRQISGPASTSSGLTASAKQLSSTQLHVVQQLGDIGLGYNAGTQIGSLNAATVGAGNSLSYASLTLDGVGTMDYNGYQSPNSGAGGPLEALQNGSGNDYLALWEVPPSTSIHGTGGAADTYEGYFTFQSNGEVDFTAATAVPEPSTCGLLATGIGLLVAAARRQYLSRAA